MQGQGRLSLPPSLFEGRVFQGVGGEGRGDLSEITREAQVQSPGVIIGPANAQIATETSRDLPLCRKGYFFSHPIFFLLRINLVFSVAN